MWKLFERAIASSVAVFAFVLFMHGVPPAAAQSSDGATCASSDTTPAIAACTRLLTQSNLSAQDRATAYRYRGLAYRRTGDNDRAIRDYDEAIRLDPKNAVTYNIRGFAYHQKADYDRAIHDYDEAI